VWYLLKVDALAAAVIFAVAGLVVLVLFAWQEAKALVAARHRIYKRLSRFTTQPQLFANPIAISRTVSRFERRDRDSSHRFQ
jgi:hypothetical protein